MKYYNLVYAKHHETDRRAYLYQLPMDADINTGNRLCVQDKRGEHFVTATSPNFFASEKLTSILCVNNGGYYPPAPVIGTIDTIKFTQEVVNKFDGSQDVTWPPAKQEEQPWF